ncbi:DUF4129 domain-containing protein [Halogranum rubrum]|uniref:DUF4129 domain-containing protein n=1 Tax=Halogranum rubrum TaxID=553466 RepID=UPI000B7E4807|nr:DUF4129 domain-containing protein [Halogranum rubrum]
MNRNTALTVVFALLAVVALSISAATLDTATTAEGGSRLGAGPGAESGVSDSDTGGGVGNEGPLFGGQVSSNFPCYPVLSAPSTVALLLAGMALLVGVVYWRTRSAILSGATLFGVGIPVVLVQSLLTACVVSDEGESSLIPTPNNGSSILPEAGGATGLNQAGEVLSAPSALLGLVLVVAVVGSVLMLFLSTGDSTEEVPEPEVEPDDTAPDVAAIGRAAGDAADRIEADADVDNEVYRAWGEMTRLLDVPRPQSSTAGEFAAAAVDAGMAREDVDELTGLFEDVRYGGADVTDEREARAVDALRRIESTYADGDDPETGGDR